MQTEENGKDQKVEGWSFVNRADDGMVQDVMLSPNEVQLVQDRRSASDTVIRRKDGEK